MNHDKYCIFATKLKIILDYQKSIELRGSEQEDILKVSRNIPSCEGFNDDQSHHSRDARGSHMWSSYR